MGKKYFKDNEVIELSNNKYVKKVSYKAITYTEEFKMRFVSEYNEGKMPTQIFIDAGFNSSVLGRKRILTASNRWRNQGIKDNRIYNTGRPKVKGLTDEEKLERLEQKIKYLEAENEF